jgi:hypothetical protein
MAGRTQLQFSGEGSRDSYLIDDPEYTPFKELFHKHTAFAMQTVNLEHLGEGKPDFGQTIRFRLASNIGDVLTNLAFRMTLPRTNRSATGYVESIGHAIIERVDFIMGDVVIQRLTSDELTIHSEHHVTQTKQNALAQLIGKYPIRSAGTRVGSKSILYYLGSQATTETSWIVDLPFWFYMKEHLAVPLCALYKQEVFVEVKLRDYTPLVVSYQNISADPDVDNATRPTLSSPIHLVDFTLDAEVVFVDEFERLKLQHTPVDYVIHQYQREIFTVAAGVTTTRVRTSFTNPVKELLCVIQREDLGQELQFCSPLDFDNITTDGGTGYGKYTAEDGLVLYEHLKSMSLTFDGTPVLDTITGNALFLKAVIGGMHHSKTQLIRRFYSYSWALEPEKDTPSGAVNMSFIKDQLVDLVLHPNPNYSRQIRLIAVSTNVLRIDEGYGRTLFDDNR